MKYKKFLSSFTLATALLAASAINPGPTMVVTEKLTEID